MGEAAREQVCKSAAHLQKMLGLSMHPGTASSSQAEGKVSKRSDGSISVGDHPRAEAA